MDPSDDDLRTAALLFDTELATGALDEEGLREAARAAPVRVRPLGRPPRRLLDDVRRRLGRLDFETGVAAPLLGLRRAVLGDGAAAPPRLIVRADEFPHYRAADAPDRYGSDGFQRFHAILAEAGVPYLLAVVPRVSGDPLSPRATASRRMTAAEARILGRLPSDGVTLALHGLDHRTRFASPRRHSELCGLPASDLEARLDLAAAELREHSGRRADVFVAPFNRFDAAQLPALTRRFRVVCGGPESVRALGFHPTPQWRGDGVYLPSYAPVYGRAAEVTAAVRRLVDAQAGLWVPVVLHWGWESDSGWRDLERLAAAIAPFAARWDEFLDATERSAARVGAPVATT